AQACGTPVIAYGRGGATETVIPLERAEEGGATGVFFYEQTIDSLIGAVRKFKENRDRFVPRTVRKNAERFNPLRFRKELDAFIREKLLEHPQEQLIDKSSPRSFRSP
ncbi:MAG: glycosyl transferase, group 1, partial [Nitrospirae bacterium]|nr:glycosyl transferase, group 1 [Nitrospirota bacterium]